MSLSPLQITNNIQSFLIGEGIPRDVAKQVDIWGIFESAKDLVPGGFVAPQEAEETEDAPAASKSPVAQEATPSSSARDSVVGDHLDVSGSGIEQSIKPTVSPPAPPEAPETAEPESPSGDNLFDDHEGGFASQGQTEPFELPPAASDVQPEPELLPADTEDFAASHTRDSPPNLGAEATTSTPASPEPEQALELTDEPTTIPYIITPELAALEPSTNALCTNRKRFDAKFEILQNCVEYLAYRLASTCVALVRDDQYAVAVCIGQFAIDLLGPNIFAIAINHFETAPTQGDSIEAVKGCLSDCVSTLKTQWNDQRRMATKLHEIIVAAGLYLDPVAVAAAAAAAAASSAAEPGPSPSNGVTKKKIQKKRRSDSPPQGPPVKGVARRIHRDSKGREKRAKMVRAGYDEDEWQ